MIMNDQMNWIKIKGMSKVVMYEKLLRGKQLFYS